VGLIHNCSEEEAMPASAAYLLLLLP